MNLDQLNGISLRHYDVKLFIEFIDRTQISFISPKKVAVQWRILKYGKDGKVSDKMMKLAYTLLTYSNKSAVIYD